MANLLRRHIMRTASDGNIFLQIIIEIMSRIIRLKPKKNVNARGGKVCIKNSNTLSSQTEASGQIGREV